MAIIGGIPHFQTYPDGPPIAAAFFSKISRKAACCRAITDDELREAVANKFRAEMFRGSVLPKYMQKLRA